jgi:hypothetical protein
MSLPFRTGLAVAAVLFAGTPAWAQTRPLPEVSPRHASSPPRLKSPAPPLKPPPAAQATGIAGHFVNLAIPPLLAVFVLGSRPRRRRRRMPTPR